MSSQYERKLAHYLMSILEGEKSVETLRQNLAEKDNFELYATFKRLDRDNKKFISVNDLKLFLNESNLNYSEFNIRELIRRFDKDRDFVINFQEFCNFILTKNDSNLRCLVTQRQTYSVDSNEYLSAEIEFALARVFEREIQLIDEFLDIANEIKSLDFNVYQAFRTIDYLNTNNLDENNISNFMRRHGYMLTPRDLQNLLSRLDRDWDGKVSYEEFKDIFNLTFDNNVKNAYSSQNQQVDLNSSNTNYNNNQINILNEEKVEQQELNNDLNNYEEKQVENNQATNEVASNSPKQDKYSNNNLNLNQQKNINFTSTMSTIKGYTSPLRESALVDLNLRASMNTYSPNRVNPSNQGFNASQTQPRNNNTLKSPFGNEFSQKLNYDYNSKYPGLIRSVDRTSKYRTTGSSFNQSRYPVNYNNNSNTSLNYSLSNFHNSKEEFFNQNYRSKLKSNSPKKFLENNQTYTSPRKDNYKLTDVKDFKRDINLTYNRPFNNNNFAQNFNSSTSFNKTVNQSKSEIEGLLAKFFQELIHIETNIEAIKESLSLKTDVKLDLIFSCFDLSKKSLVSVPDFIETLKSSLDIFSGVEDIKLLFKRFDQDLDCKLSFNEFSQMLSPKKPEYARLVRERRNYGYEVDLSLESKLILIKLLRTLIEGENLIEHNRHFLTSRPLFSSYDAFDAVKGKYQNFILKENLNYFMQKNSIFNSQFELDVLFDRFDKNRDGKISFNEFIQEILPKSYYSY